MIKSKETLYGLMVLGAGSLWGTMSIFSKTLTEGYGFSATEVVMLRALSCFLIVGAVILFTDRSLFKIRIKDIWMFLGSGILSIAFFNICYFTAINLVGASTACILLYTSPVFVMLMSAVFFKEKITLVKILSMILAFFGCVMVLAKNLNVNVPGVLVGVMSGFGYALYSIFGKFAANKKYSSLTITFYSFLIAFLFLAPMCDFSRMVKCFALDGYSYIWVLMTGIIVTAIPYFLYTKGIENIENSKAIIIASIEPVVATVVGLICFNQGITPLAFLGIITVIISITLMNSKLEKKY